MPVFDTQSFYGLSLNNKRFLNQELNIPLTMNRMMYVVIGLFVGSVGTLLSIYFGKVFTGPAYVIVLSVVGAVLFIGLLILLASLFFNFKISFTRSESGERKNDIDNEISMGAILQKLYPSLSNQESDRINNTISKIISLRFTIVQVQILFSIFIAFGGLLGTVVLVNQNDLISDQSRNLANQNNLISDQNRISNLQLIELRNQQALKESENMFSLDGQLDDKLQSVLYDFRIFKKLNSLFMYKLKDLMESLPRRYTYTSPYGEYTALLSPEKGIILTTLLDSISDTTELDKAFTQLDFSYSYLNGVDLSNKYLKGIKLIGSSIENTNLTKSILDHSDLSSVSLRGSLLKDVSLVNTKLVDATLTVNSPVCRFQVYRSFDTQGKVRYAELRLNNSDQNFIRFVDVFDRSCLQTYLSFTNYEGLDKEGISAKHIQTDKETIDLINDNQTNKDFVPKMNAGLSLATYPTVYNGDSVTVVINRKSFE